MSDGAGNEGVWVQEFRVHSYEVDFKRCASLESVCRFFLEAAWNHAEQLGFGYTQLARQGKLWVLSRLLVHLERLPGWGETATVRTWPREARGVFAMRDFEMSDAVGKPLAVGTSAWLILDSSTRRPQRAERILGAIRNLPERRATPDDPAKLPGVDSAMPGRAIETRYSDVDVNSHVNSCRYVGFLMDDYPFEFHRQHSPVRLEVNYLGETRAGDQLTVRVSESGSGANLPPGAGSIPATPAEASADYREFLHGLRKADQEVLLARIRWRRSHA